MNPHLLWMPAKWVPNFLAVTTFVIVLFIALVVHDTLWGDSNITVEPGTARGWNNSTGLVVEYSRAFRIHKTADGDVQRVVRCPPDGTDSYYMDGPLIRRTFQEGYYPALKRPMQFPQRVPEGTKCVLEVWGTWRPRFAISAKRFLLDRMEFIVDGRP